MKKIANVYIFFILIYVVLAWWLGKTQVNKTGHTIKIGIEKNCKKLDLI